MATRKSYAARPAPPPKAAGAAQRQRAPARKSPKAPAPPPEQEVEGSSLWQAGLRALKTAKQDAERRHASVVETLLGLSPGGATPNAAPRPPFVGLDAFGLRKFEDVFDQRVAAALDRLGAPTREEVASLREQLDRLSEQLARWEAQAAPERPAASARSATAKAPKAKSVKTAGQGGAAAKRAPR